MFVNDKQCENALQYHPLMLEVRPLAGSRKKTQRNADADSELRPDLGRFVANLAQAVDRGTARAMASDGLLPLEVYLLLICRDMKECTATQLAGLLPVDAARISRLVNGLVDRGLVLRRRPRSDRRVVILRLSPQGEELTSEAARRMEELYAGLTQGLSEAELHTFAAAATRIIANYEAMSNS